MSLPVASCAVFRKSSACAEAELATPHKQARGLTPRLGKKTIYGRKLDKMALKKEAAKIL
jgi:hypothetical protein